jgi:radical SAM superfamily enzyme YgiQ (UPF0313 family)
MVHLGLWNNRPVTISEKPNSITFSLEEKESTQVFSFDMEYRLWTALINQVSYRRGLNGNIVAKWNSGKEILHRSWLDHTEREKLLTRAHLLIREFLINDPNQNGNFSPPLTTNVLEHLKHIANQTLHFYKNDIDRYHQVYKPVGILPPDQYNSVVLQVTEGCSFNTCTFCDFYKDRPFRIKMPHEFLEHARQVNQFIGKGLNLRRTIFLGDANALVTPTRKLIPLLEIVNQTFDVNRLGGMFAFLDGFSGEKKTVQDYLHLKQLGMEKIYIGLESGDDALLKFLNKPGKAKDALKAVEEIKKGGLSVGVIILLGAGGHQFAQQHIQNTVKLINQMTLDADDLVYFSELIENSDLEYTKKAYQANLSPLSPLEREQQGQIMLKDFKFYRNDAPHISRYDIRDFVY